MDGAGNTLPPDAPSPRLCHIKKRPDFTGYGFNLHAEKGKSGQFIGKVDPGSPAELAGLKEGDRIVEVNGTNVSNENHQQVVQRIKAVPDETKFLVVDKAADEYYREKKIVVKSDMSNVVVIVTPSVETNSTAALDPKFSPRLCHLKIWADFTGYGFNLHAEKGKVVQYIGKVDADSPAELAGLKENDRIVEVNGKSVASLSHQEVVKMIKSDPKEVKLLVVDKATDDYFQKQGLVPSGTVSTVKKITCPDANPGSSASKSHVPRLCHVKARPDGKGFGFNMQAQKGKPGQYIGKVDPGSPAEASGLRDGDVIIEVNGVNVEKQTHKEVVEKIKMVPNETTLLVIDKQGYEASKADGIVITSAMVVATTGTAATGASKETTTTTTTTTAIKTENGEAAKHDESETASKPVVEEEEDIDDDAEDDEDEKNNGQVAVVATTTTTTATVKMETTPKKEEQKPDKSTLKLDVTSASASTTTTTTTVVVKSPSSASTVSSSASVESPKSPVVIGGIEFSGSAEEARKKMKKRNVKDTNMSIKAKYDLFQKL